MADEEFADTRERLEADCEELVDRIQRRTFSGRDAGALRCQLKELLDRQAAITERELCNRCSPYATAKDYLDTIDSLTAERDKWHKECDNLREKLRNKEGE